MSYSATVVKIMIASPSDVPAERNIVREVLADWNALNSDQHKVVLLPVSWETHSSPSMGSRPQEIINKQILIGCDILIGVFWTRLGTATGEYASGTVEEIEEHIKAGGHAMLYFSRAPVDPESVIPDQYRQLKEFRSSCESRGLYKQYVDLQDFRNSLYRHLQIFLNTDPFSARDNKPAAPEGALNELPPIPRLGLEASYLLKEAAKSKGSEVLNIEYLSGHSIQVGEVNLIEDDDDRSRATWVGALEELESQDFLRPANSKRQIFRVTRSGFEMADRLP